MWPLGARTLSRLELGRLGEQRAVWFYRLRGWSILGRNVRSRTGEIDIIVRRGKILAFVEVKTRQTLSAGEGWASVDARKQTRLYDLANRYVAHHRLGNLTIRFDIISAFWTGRRLVLTQFKDAFGFVADERQPWRVHDATRPAQRR